MNDRGLWVTWYDLPEKGREQHLEWLHKTYIPKILSKPGVLWAAHYKNAGIAPHPRLRHTDDPSVPAGNDYMLFFGGETAHAFTAGAEHFFAGAPHRLQADLTSQDRDMLAMRVAARECVFTEESRADGPEAHRRSGKMGPPPCIQIGSFNAPGCEEELMSWYGDWRIPALSKLPGCVGIRKLVSAIGWAKHAVLYEFASLELRHENMPKLRTIYVDEGQWSDRFVPALLHAPASPVVGSRIWPPVEE
jgi:hypothetical protein